MEREDIITRREEKLAEKEIEVAKAYQDIRIKKKRLDQEEAKTTLKEPI